MPPKIDANAFVLQPCKVRQGSFVPTKDEPITLNWKELVNKFAPERTRNGLLCLRSIQIFGFIGKVKTLGGQATALFFMTNQDRSGKINPELVKGDKWVDTVVEVYRVEKAQWAAKVVEVRGA